MKRFDHKLLSGHRPLLWISVFFALGIITADAVKIEISVMYFGLLVLLLVGAALIRFRFFSSMVLVILIFFAGMVLVKSRTILSAGHIRKIPWAQRKDLLEVQGKIVSPVESKEMNFGIKTSFLLEVKAVKIQDHWRKKKGKLLVNLFRKEKLAYGDSIIARGKMHTPMQYSSDEDFSYRDYLQKKGIYFLFSIRKNGKVKRVAESPGIILGRLYHLREKCREVYVRYLTPAEAGLMQAVILGMRKNIPSHIKTLFEVTGVAHLLAISALHLGTVTFCLLILVKVFPLHRKFQYSLCIVCLIFYAVLTGGRPSIIRATVMAVIFLLSFILEQEPDLLSSLGLAAMIILIINPLSLYDIGFQLSFMSVIFILTFFPFLQKGLQRVFSCKKSRFAAGLRDSFCVSIAAYLGVAGLIAYHFHIITPISIFLNVLIIPLFSLLVILGVGILLVEVTLPFFTPFFAICIKVLLNVITGIIYLHAQIPGAYFHLDQFSLKFVILYYIFTFSGLFLISLYYNRLETKKNK